MLSAAYTGDRTMTVREQLRGTIVVVAIRRADPTLLDGGDPVLR